MSSVLNFYKIGEAWLLIDGFECGYGYEFEYNGKLVKDAKPITFSEAPKCVVKIKHYNDFICAKNEKGETLTPEQWESLRAQLYLYDSEMENWPSLDAEFAYRKFEREWEKVFAPSSEADVLEFQVVDLGTENLPPYTTPIRLANPDTNNRNFGLFTYSPNRMEMMCKMSLKYGITYCGENSQKGRCWSIPNHSKTDLDFIKVNDAYARSAKGMIVGCIGTLEECQNLHNKNLLLMEEFWSIESAKLDDSPIKKESRGRVIQNLESIYSTLCKVESKQNTYQSFISARNAVKSLIGEISKES